MFRSLRQRLILGLYVFLLLSIPVGAYLASRTQNPNASASNSNRTITTTEPSPTTSKLQSLLNEISSPEPSPSSDSSADTFGPIMDFFLLLEGRPENKQSATVFVGIAEGELTSKPSYVLTFTITLPDDGKYPNLSLAGLTSGSRYSAYLKGPSQIATASGFTMSAFTTHLNAGAPLTTLSGDLNDDNVINSADLTIGIASLGLSSNSSEFNDNADFNKDGVVNSIDIAYILKNMNRTGASGHWISPPPATESGSPSGGLGYWLWVPDI